MKNIIGLLILACVSLNANAQLLWKISGKGLSKPSYVVGTHHLVSASFADSINGLKKVMDETSQVYGEILISEATSPAFLQEIQKYVVLPGDTTLKQLFTEEQYEVVGKVVKENLMADIAMFNKVKPALISQQLGVAAYMKNVGGFNPNDQLDGYLQKHALESGKVVQGLETVESQLNLLLKSQTLQRQADLLYCMADNMKKGIEQMKRMTLLYKAQDIEGLFKLMEERENTMCDPQPKELEDLLDNRNKQWVKKIPEIMKGSPTLFVVGAGHLAGKSGILHLLRQQGYSISPVQ